MVRCTFFQYISFIKRILITVGSRDPHYQCVIRAWPDAKRRNTRNFCQKDLFSHLKRIFVQNEFLFDKSDEKCIDMSTFSICEFYQKDINHRWFPWPHNQCVIRAWPDAKRRNTHNSVQKDLFTHLKKNGQIRAFFQKSKGYQSPLIPMTLLSMRYTRLTWSKKGEIRTILIRRILSLTSFH